MKIADNASIDDNTHGGGEIPPRTGLTPDALPEVQEPVLTENSQTGIPTRKALSGSTLKTIKGETERSSRQWLTKIQNIVFLRNCCKIKKKDVIMFLKAAQC